MHKLRGVPRCQCTLSEAFTIVTSTLIPALVVQYGKAQRFYLSIVPAPTAHFRGRLFCLSVLVLYGSQQSITHKHELEALKFRAGLAGLGCVMALVRVPRQQRIMRADNAQRPGSGTLSGSGVRPCWQRRQSPRRHSDGIDFTPQNPDDAALRDLEELHVERQEFTQNAAL